MKRYLVRLGYVCCILLIGLAASAQTTTLMPVPRTQFLDTSGNPLSGGKVATFIAGTSTPQATYTDSTGGTPHPNPVILDSGGFASIWLTPTLSYKFTVSDSADVLQYTVDVVRTGLLQDASGAITACSVIFGGTGGIVAQDNANLCFDDANNRFGIGTATPTDELHVIGEATFDNNADVEAVYNWISGKTGVENIKFQFATFGDSNIGTLEFSSTATTLRSITNIAVIQANATSLSLRPTGQGDCIILEESVGGSDLMTVCDAGTTGDVTITGTLTVAGQISETKWIPAAGCSNVTASTVWDLFTSNTPAVACVTGSQTTKGVFDFDDAADEHAQITFLLPDSFSGTLDVKFIWFGVNTSGDVVWFVQTSCAAIGETDDPAWNSASFIADTAQGTTLQMNSASITGITTTGCAAGELLHLRWGRDGDGSLDTDDFVGDARGYGVELAFVP